MSAGHQNVLLNQSSDAPALGRVLPCHRQLRRRRRVLAPERRPGGTGQQVRLWIDDTSALRAMAPGAPSKGHLACAVLDWCAGRIRRPVPDWPGRHRAGGLRLRAAGRLPVWRFGGRAHGRRRTGSIWVPERRTSVAALRTACPRRCCRAGARSSPPLLLSRLRRAPGGLLREAGPVRAAPPSTGRLAAWP